MAAVPIAPFVPASRGCQNLACAVPQEHTYIYSGGLLWLSDWLKGCVPFPTYIPKLEVEVRKPKLVKNQDRDPRNLTGKCRRLNGKRRLANAARVLAC